jgi:transcriptional regulator with XRE-family HTH domain
VAPSKTRKIRATSILTPKLGARLVELRKRVGLTQSQVASLMGRTNKAYKTAISRLERGDYNPTLSMLGDYLRACRASFAEIAVLLDEYTSRPTRPERLLDQKLDRLEKRLPSKVARAVARYDEKHAAKTEPRSVTPEQAERRLARARRYARSQVWRTRLHRHIVGIVSAHKWGKGAMWEEGLQDYCRRVWAIMDKIRGRLAGRRESMLADEQARMLANPLYRPEQVSKVGDATARLYEDALRSGELDILPDAVPDEAGGGRRGASAVTDDYRAEVNRYDDARRAVVEQLWTEAQELLRSAGVDQGKHALYRNVVLECCHIVDHHAPGSPEAERELADNVRDPRLVALGQDPVLFRRLAGLVVPRYEELRRTLPPAPSGKLRPATQSSE